MLDGLSTDHLIGYASGWTIVGLFVIALLTGRLLPRASVVRENEQWKSQAERAQHDAQEWRTEGRIKDQQIAVLYEQLAVKDGQLSRLSEVGRTMEAVLDAVTPRHGEST